MSVNRNSYKELKSVDIRLCDDNRGQINIFDKEKIVTLKNKNFLSKWSFLPFSKYHKLWVEIEKVDEKLEISNPNQLITVKAAGKTGTTLQDLVLEDDQIKYEVLLNTKLIKDYKDIHTENPQAKIDFSVKCKANPKEADHTIGKYRKIIRLIRCDPEINLEIALEKEGLSRCWSSRDKHCLIATATVITHARAKFCHPLVLQLQCKIRGREKAPEVVFGNRDEISFRTAERDYGTETDCYIYKDRKGHKFKIPNFQQERSKCFEIRQLMPDNEMFIPIFIDASQLGGDCWDSLILSLEATITYNLFEIKRKTKSKPFMVCHQFNVSGA